MEAIEIIVIFFAVLLVGSTIGLAVYRKKKGKSSCGCDCQASKNKASAGGCAGCPYCDSCHAGKNRASVCENEEKNESEKIVLSASETDSNMKNTL